MSRVRVKICGLSSREEVQLAVKAGADAVGFVVDVPDSPRNLSVSEARRLIRSVPVFVESVAITVPEDVRLAATKLVAGIIEEKNIEIAGEIKSEKLGEYAITLQDVEKMANHLGIKEILDHYRRIYV